MGNEARKPTASIQFVLMELLSRAHVPIALKAHLTSALDIWPMGRLPFPLYSPVPFKQYCFGGVRVHAQSLQSCLTACDPVDCSLAGSSVHGILQARILEWIDILSSRGSSPPRDLPHQGIKPLSPASFASQADS